MPGGARQSGRGTIMFNLFAYGTLQLPEVFCAVTGLDRIGEPATLAGYARYALHGLTYPGLIAEPGTATQGLLYCGLDDGAATCLDHFEDDFYCRASLWVTTVGGRRHLAEAYVIPFDESAVIDRRPWVLDDFCRQHLHDFLSCCRTSDSRGGHLSAVRA